MTEIVVTHITGSTLAGREQRFAKAMVKLGRRPDNDVAFDPDKDRKASGYHAELTAEGGALLLKDLGSQNGTFLNGVRLTSQVTVKAGDIVRLGEGGPEMRVELRAGASGGGGAGPGAGSGGKKGIGEETLARAINGAVGAERSRSRRSIFVTLAIVGLIAAGGGIWAIQREQKMEELTGETKRLGAELERARRAAEELQKKTDAAVTTTLAQHEAELKKISGKISGEEERVARLIVEIQERDRSIDEIKSAQDLSEEQRKAMIADTESKMKRLQEDLAKSEATLRKSAQATDTLWADLVDRYKESIFLCVAQDPVKKQQGIGTGFLIRDDGIIGTNAHVAKMMREMPNKVCIQNHTGVVFQVKRITVHPNFTTPNSPDVALLQVDLGGAKIGPAFSMADDDDLRKLRIGSQLGTLGYPGELSDAYFSSRDESAGRFKSVLATFKNGFIGRITNYSVELAAFEDSKFIQHSASLSGGTSGSPMFSPDGKVVALNNSGLDKYVLVQSDDGSNPKVERTPSAAQIGFAIRVDELRKLLKTAGW